MKGDGSDVGMAMQGGPYLPGGGGGNAADFFRIVPDGVTLAMTQLSIQILDESDIARANSEIDRAVKYLATRNVDCIVAAGAPMVRHLGVGSDDGLIDKIQSETGIPATTTQTAAVHALRHVGAKRVAVATPYHENQDQKVKAFLEGSGFEVTKITGLRRDVVEIHEISLGDAYHHAKSTFFADPTAQAIYVPCGHFTVPNVPTLEEETGVPVITSTMAMIWGAFRLCNVWDPSLERHGRVFSRTP